MRRNATGAVDGRTVARRRRGRVSATALVSASGNKAAELAACYRPCMVPRPCHARYRTCQISDTKQFTRIAEIPTHSKAMKRHRDIFTALHRMQTRCIMSVNIVFRFQPSTFGHN